jgi:uncharacterized membrane protein
MRIKMEKDLSDTLLLKIYKEQRMYASDDGFSDRVVKALPTKKNIIFIKTCFMVTTILSIAILFLFYFSGTKYLITAFQEIFTLSIIFRPPSTVSIALISLIVWVVISLLNWHKKEVCFPLNDEGR